LLTPIGKKFNRLDLITNRQQRLWIKIPRVNKYWELKKSEAEVEVMKNLYEISKKFPDKNLEDKLLRGL